MIRNFKYLDTAVQLRLHESVIDFFNRIEFERGIFQNSFFNYTLSYLAVRHPKIVKLRCELIYNAIRFWTLAERTELFNLIRESNSIENICSGNYSPKKLEKKTKGVYGVLRGLFIDLYEQVLDGDGFRDLYSTTLRSHFDDFSKLNSEITLCPVCGIGELKKHTDISRDQYDHYLPKAIYPLSSVNFKNLVPVCKECNSFDAKGETDVVAVSTNRKMFFLFDDTHQGISVSFQILVDDINPNKIQWLITYTNPQGKNDEVESWKTIYKIESRYVGFVNARVEKWYRHYWEFINDLDLSHLSLADRQLTCFKSYEKDESLQLNFIRKPALEGFLAGSTLAQAAIEAQYYSIPPTA